MVKNDIIFHKISKKSPPKRLLNKVLNRLSQENRLVRLKRRFFISSFLFFGSLILCLPAAGWLLKDFSRSGFFEYLGLIFSDFYVVLTYWQDFSLTVLETLPAAALIAVLSIFILVIASGRNLFNSITELKKTTHLNLNRYGHE